MANRGSKKKIPLTIKEVSIVSRVICYILAFITLIACVLSCIYSINKVGLINRNVDTDYVVSNVKYDTMFMFGSYYDNDALETLVVNNPTEYLEFVTLTYAKYAIQYLMFALIMCAVIAFLDFDNLKNPFTIKSSKMIDVIIGCVMVMFFVNIIINFQIRMDTSEYLSTFNAYVYPLIYLLITCALLIFNYCIRTGKNMIEGVK